jgi:hypothetical protein
MQVSSKIPMLIYIYKKQKLNYNFEAVLAKGMSSGVMN